MKNGYWRLYVHMFFLSSLLQILHLYAQGVEGKCTVEFDRNSCVRRVICGFGPAIVHQKKNFVIRYKPEEQPEEVIGDCDWSGTDSSPCDPAQSFTTDTQLNPNFTITLDCETRCITSGDFWFDAVEEQPIKCHIQPAQDKTPSTTANNITDLKSEDSPQSSNGLIIGICIGAVLLIMLIIILVAVGVALFRKKRESPEPSESKKPMLTQKEKEEQNSVEKGMV